MDYDSKIEELQKRLKVIEQEYMMTMGKVKQLEELQKEQSEDKKEKDK